MAGELKKNDWNKMAGQMSQMHLLEQQPNQKPLKLNSQDLFDAALLSKEIDMPDGYIMRPLNINDYDFGYLDCLKQLKTVGVISKSDFQERFLELQRLSKDYFSIVIEEKATKQIVGSGSVLIEKKFIRQCGKVGHIEDIVVHSSQRGKNFGKKIIDQLTFLGKQAGCYKIILCCDEKNVCFYEKCGYKKKEVEMVLYF